ncbi:MAG: YIP1 family protein [Gemmatimonadales bacterium]
MQDALDLFRVLYEPTAVFERIRERPRILIPFVVLCVLTVILSLATAPVQQAAAALFQPRTPDAAAATPPGAVAMLIRAVIGAPFSVGLGLLASGFILWLTTSLFGPDAQFKTLVSVAAHTFLVGLLYQAVGSAVLMMRGLETIAAFQDLQIALGLNLLWPDGSGFLWNSLGAVNPFGIWGLVLAAIGVQTTHRVQQGTAYSIATVSFVIKALALAALASLAMKFVPQG